MFKQLLTICINLSLAGIALSIYLTYLTLTATPSCGFDYLLGCSEVLTSPYSSIGPIPVAMLGTVWFSVSLALSSLSMKRHCMIKLLFSWGLVAVVGIAVLTYIQVVFIRSLCYLCLGSYIVGIAITTSSYIAGRNMRKA